ncbi:MAG: amidohydrolase family protein [Deltaproteobacteria bacterium]|nr:amidohydrolase family protein [Deltaproteobacteria bacterium]
MKTFLLRPDGLRRGPLCDSVPEPWVFILDGSVAAVAPGPAPELPEGTPVLRGGWLVEPLADAHVHLSLSGSRDVAERRRVGALGREASLERVLGLLQEYRRAGIAVVRDGGDRTGIVLEAAATANRRPDRFAAVRPAGEAVYRAGFYGSFLGSGARDVREAAALLERNRALGATLAKFLATGLNGLVRAGEVEPGGFSEAELSELISVAHALGLPPMIHANGPLGGLARCLAPETTLEHGFWMASDDLADLAKAGAAWTPTVGAWAALDGLGLPAQQLAVVGETHGRQLQAVREAEAAGVELLAGSDAGTPGVEHVSGLFGELGRLREAGLRASSALAASCSSTRRRLERALGRPVGSLELGEPAGFVWLEADPVSQPEALRCPWAVFLGGAWTGSRELPTPNA